MSADKRQFKRISYLESVQYRRPTATTPIGTVAQDLSENGVRFQTEDFIPIHEPLTLQLKLGNNEVLDVHGRVVWVQAVPYAERYQVGIKFDDSESMANPRKILRQYVNSRQSS